MDYVRRGVRRSFPMGLGWTRDLCRSWILETIIPPGSPGGDRTPEGSGSGVSASSKSPFHRNGRDIPFRDLKGPQDWDHSSLSHSQWKTVTGVPRGLPTGAGKALDVQKFLRCEVLCCPLWEGGWEWVLCWFKESAISCSSDFPSALASNRF